MDFTKNEIVAFYDAIDAEFRKCINEYDEHTGRRPSKKRIANSKYAKTVIQKITDTQPKIRGTAFIDLDKFTSCHLDLTPQETSYCRALLLKSVENNRKYLATFDKPYEGVLQKIATWTDTAEIIIRNLE